MSESIREWDVEWREYEDPVSGARVKQLTNYRGHSHHLYFTNSGWYDGDRKLLFGSDRDNRYNLFSINLETGDIAQLTDLDPSQRVGFLVACVNPTKDEAYFWYGSELRALDLHTLKMRTIATLPPGFRSSITNCTADGLYVCTGHSEDLSHRIRTDFSRGYVGFPETWEAKPLCRVIRCATDGSGEEILHEEKCWIGHINTSPTQPNLLTFCHEGPWNLVDNRIWCMDMETKKVWKVRLRKNDKERIGHEYWYSDGVRIGYHGVLADGNKVIGHIRHDNEDNVEVSFPYETGHTHSNDEKLVVGDGGSVVRAWKWTGDGYDGPRIVCVHRSSKHIQRLHVHPRLNRAGTHVLYTSDTSDYGNVYLAEIPEFESLPKVDS